MVFLVFFYYYLIFGNVLFLCLLSLNSKGVLFNKNLLFFISFGSAPLVVGLLYYYSVYLLPGKSDFVYSSIIFLSALVLFLCGFKNSSILVRYYKDIIEKVKSVDWKNYKVIALTLFIFLYFTVVFIQAVYYPVMDDQSAYINQGKAAYYVKHDLQDSSTIKADSKNTILYNSAIRPGVTSYFAATILIDKQQISSQNYYSCKIFSFYYYLLLFCLFVFVIKKIKGIKNILHLFLISSLFMFFWILSRMVMYNTKEIPIFFFTLLSLFLLDLVVKSKDRKGLWLSMLLGGVCGLNIFINVHGLVIFVFLLALLTIFSKNSFGQRLTLGIVIFIAAVFFSAFDIFTMFASILSAGFRDNQLISSVINPIETFLAHRVPSLFNQSDQVPANTNYLSSLDGLHKNLYDTHSILSIYLKGKLQFLTNFGYYSLRGWLVLITIVAFLKKIWNNNLLKIILAFVVVYYVVVLDPFNLNRNQNAIVLFGSANYSTLLVFLGLVFVGIYLMDIYDFLVRGIFFKKTYFLVFFVLISGILVIFREKIINVLTDHLYLLLSINKNLEFYRHKIEIFIVFAILFFGVSALLVFLSYFNKAATKFFVVIVFVVTMVLPFFLFEPGKIALSSTFVDIGKGNEYKLKNSLIVPDYFDIYFNAKKILPANSVVATDNPNLLAYNNYFQMSIIDALPDSKEVGSKTFYIMTTCPVGSKIIQTIGNTNLCNTIN